MVHIDFVNFGTRVQRLYQNNIALDVHCLPKTRLCLFSSYLFYSWTRFPWTNFLLVAVIHQDDPLWTSLEFTFSVSSCYISIHPREGKSFRHFHKNKNPRNTNFTIGGFLAGLPRSPLILCLLFQDFQVLSDH